MEHLLWMSASKQTNLLVIDPDAEFEGDNVRQVRHSKCGENITVKVPYDTSYVAPLALCGLQQPPPTLPPSTASPRRSFLDLPGSFDAQGSPLDRGRVSAVGRVSPSVATSLPVAGLLPGPTGSAPAPGPDFRAPMRCPG